HLRLLNPHLRLLNRHPHLRPRRLSAAMRPKLSPLIGSSSREPNGVLVWYFRRILLVSGGALLGSTPTLVAPSGDPVDGLFRASSTSVICSAATKASFICGCTKQH